MGDKKKRYIREVKDNDIEKLKQKQIQRQSYGATK